MFLFLESSWLVERVSIDLGKYYETRNLTHDKCIHQHMQIILVLAARKENLLDKCVNA